MSGSNFLIKNAVLDIRPGLMSALYFLLFDMVLITIIDLIMSRAMFDHYYKRAIRGQPIKLKSVDIPGVTTFLIGNFFSTANLTATITKIIVLAAIFTVDVELDSFIKPKQIQRSAYLKLNASDEYWENQDFDLVYLHRDPQYCREYNSSANTITYYSVALDLEGNETSEAILSPEPSPSVERECFVNQSTTQCLMPGQVAEEDVLLNARVIGCSEIESDDCVNRGYVSMTLQKLKLNKTYRKKAKVVFIRPHVHRQRLLRWLNFTHLEDLSIYVDMTFPHPWSEYKNATVVCANLVVGLNQERSKSQYQCLLLANYVYQGRRGTIFEHWKLSQSPWAFFFDQNDPGGEKKLKMIRVHPGAVFEGNVEMGDFQKMSLLYQLQTRKSQSDWFALSNMIVEIAAAYTRKDLNIAVLDTGHQQSVVPIYAIIIIAAIFFATAISFIVVSFKLGMFCSPTLANISDLEVIAVEQTKAISRIKSSDDNADVAGLRSERGKHSVYICRSDFWDSSVKSVRIPI